MDLNQKIIDALNRVVAGKEDYVYDENFCRYVKNGHPSCLWGHVLVDLGIPAAHLETAYHSTAIQIVLHEEFAGTPDLVDIERAAAASQRAQDGRLETSGDRVERKTWGRARDIYIETIARLN